MEATETVQPLPKPKRKAARRAKPKPKVEARQETPEFLGLTAEECCADCCMERCVITAKPICGHPRKGGLQPPDMLIAATISRYQRAAKFIAHQAVDRKD